MERVISHFWLETLPPCHTLSLFCSTPSHLGCCHTFWMAPYINYQHVRTITFREFTFLTLNFGLEFIMIDMFDKDFGQNICKRWLVLTLILAALFKFSSTYCINWVPKYLDSISSKIFCSRTCIKATSGK